MMGGGHVAGHELRHLLSLREKYLGQPNPALSDLHAAPRRSAAVDGARKS
jgi:hypothetical protein